MCSCVVLISKMRELTVLINVGKEACQHPELQEAVPQDGIKHDNKSIFPTFIKTVSSLILLMRTTHEHI